MRQSQELGHRLWGKSQSSVRKTKGRECRLGNGEIMSTEVRDVVGPGADIRFYQMEGRTDLERLVRKILA